MSLLSNEDLKNIVDVSNGVQRNFDLSVDIPEEDLDTLIYIASHCPSKNGIALYQLHVITDKELISDLHDASMGAMINGKFVTNSQTLANVLFVYEQIPQKNLSPKAKRRFIENSERRMNSDPSWYYTPKQLKEMFSREVRMAVGVAGGYVDLAANLMGYKTGFCHCYNDNISDILLTESVITLMQGIGVPDPNLNRRQHAITKEYFKSVPKEPIKIIRW